MKIQELLDYAETTYPPTQIVLKTICSRVGAASEIADSLRLGSHGARTVRKWISYPSTIPFSVWLALLAFDEDCDEP